MLIWDDADGDGEIHHITKDSYYFKISGMLDSISDQEDGVLRLNDYHMNGAHFTTMLFVGPNAAANSKKWNEFVAQLEDPSSVNVSAVELLGECFKG